VDTTCAGGPARLQADRGVQVRKSGRSCFDGEEDTKSFTKEEAVVQLETAARGVSGG